MTIENKPGFLGQYLDDMDRLITANSTARVTLEGFIRRYGREWVSAPLPRKVRRGRMGECYNNAGLLACSDERLTYCEGVAINLLPVQHAWCVKPNGRVVDPTWSSPQDCHYFGVPFKTDFIRRMALERQHFGVIDLWEERWPLLRGAYPVEAWWEKKVLASCPTSKVR